MGCPRVAGWDVPVQCLMEDGCDIPCEVDGMSQLSVLQQCDIPAHNGWQYGMSQHPKEGRWDIPLLVHRQLVYPRTQGKLDRMSHLVIGSATTSCPSDIQDGTSHPADMGHPIPTCSTRRNHSQGNR